jgi:uncharacterized protein YoxC
MGQSPKNSSKNIIIGFLAVALLGSWAYFLLKINNSDKEIQQRTEEGVKFMSQRDSLALLYDFATKRYDSVTVANNDLQGKLTDKQSDITRLKGEINSILKKKNATQEELNTARQKIEELNDKIANLEAEVAQLRTENQTLTTANTQLTQDKQSLETNLVTTQTEKKALEETVDVGFTFSASNIQITPVNERKGGKEKETSTAKKVDKLVVSFDVENRVARSGPADLYVMVTAPDGKVISDGASTLNTRNEGDRAYTYKSTINYEQGTRQSIKIPLRQDHFQTGNYKIEIFQNGFKIAEGVRSLKKGGLFG